MTKQNDLQQLLAVSAALLKLEQHAASGWLPEEEEQATRLLAARVGRAFGLDSKAERRSDNVFELVKSPAVYVR